MSDLLGAVFVALLIGFYLVIGVILLARAIDVQYPAECIWFNAERICK